MTKLCRRQSVPVSRYLSCEPKGMACLILGSLKGSARNYAKNAPQDVVMKLNILIEISSR